MITATDGDGPTHRTVVSQLVVPRLLSTVCGGDDVTDGVATCIAKAFHESDLSDDALQAIVGQDEDYDASDEDTDALRSLSSGAVTDCVADATK